MNDPLPDDDLSGLFTRQRTSERGRAPAFHGMRTRAIEGAGRAAPPHVIPTWRWVAAAAALLMLGVGGFFSMHQRTPPPAVSREDVVREIAQVDEALQKSLAAQSSLTAWQSPTDFLLHSIHSESP
jgi:hypothetical protein